MKFIVALAAALFLGGCPPCFADTPGQVINLQCPAHQWFEKIKPGSGNIVCTQPGFPDISGSIAVGQVPTLNQSTTGNAATCTALATAPTTCSAGNAPRGVDTGGNSLNCTPYQAPGSYMTALTGDVSAAGPGSSAATVNSVGGSTAANVHSGELAANAATALNTALATMKRDGAGQVSATTFTGALAGNATSATALAGTPTTCSAGNAPRGVDTGGNAVSCTAYQSPGSYLTALTGDGTAAGPGSAPFTLATVATPGTATKVTFNAKGLVTSGTTLSSGDIPNNAANTTGNANTATALASVPTQCTAPNYATGIAASGNANCTNLSVQNELWTDGVKGSDSTGNGTATYPYATIGKLATVTGSAADTTAFAVASTAYYHWHIAPGVYSETVSVPTRQYIEMDMDGVQINGGVTWALTSAASGTINRPQLVLKAAGLRNVYNDGNHPVVGVIGNISFTTSGSVFPEISLAQTGATGTVNYAGTSAITVLCSDCVIGGGVTTSGGGQATLKAENSNYSGSRSIGGTNGNVILDVLNGVTFSGLVVSTATQGGVWTNTIFKSGANDFTSGTGTVNADDVTKNSWDTNVPTPGGVTLSRMSGATASATANKLVLRDGNGNTAFGACSFVSGGAAGLQCGSLSGYYARLIETSPAPTLDFGNNASKFQFYWDATHTQAAAINETSNQGFILMDGGGMGFGNFVTSPLSSYALQINAANTQVSTATGTNLVSGGTVSGTNLTSGGHASLDCALTGCNYTGAIDMAATGITNSGPISNPFDGGGNGWYIGSNAHAHMEILGATNPRFGFLNSGGTETGIFYYRSGTLMDLENELSNQAISLYDAGGIGLGALSYGALSGYALQINAANTIVSTGAAVDILAGGNVIANTAGKGLQVKGGANSKIGSGTLAAGTVTISNTSVTANSRIFTQDNTSGSLANVGSLVVSAVSAGTSFTVKSSNILDTSTFWYFIVEEN